MANYKISDTTLTSIGDAIRSKVGETRVEQVQYENPYEFNFDYADCNHDDLPDYNANTKIVFIPVVTNKNVKRIEFVFNCEANSAAGRPDIRKIRYDWGENPYDRNNGAYYLDKNTSGTKNIPINGEEEYLVFRWEANNTNASIAQLKVNASVYLYDANDNLITQELVEVPNTMTPAQMAQAINDMAPGLTDEELTITGDCRYRFAYNGWNWLIKKYGDKITTKDITNGEYLFTWYDKEESIPFELNFKPNQTVNIGYMFSNAAKLTSIPKINYCKPLTTASMFSYCSYLRYLPDDIGDWFDWSHIDNLTSQYDGSRSSVFNGCNSLRKLPMSFLKHGNPNTTTSYNIYGSLANYCYVLDEIIGLPFPHLNSTWTSNTFGYTIGSTNRLKNFTFATQDDGTPYTVKWKSQTIDFSSNIGYATYSSYILNYNSGITADKEVKDDATYQALKDNPDWYSLKVEYSRYNHDSAVNTINSLPDASAYLATAGGTNTIKFKGAAGSKTDGGAINTLTAEEIAVAASKGWTVTLV